MPVSVGHRRGGDSACARVVPDLSIYLLVLKVFYHPTLKIAIGLLSGFWTTGLDGMLQIRP